MKCISSEKNTCFQSFVWMLKFCSPNKPLFLHLCCQTLNSLRMDNFTPSIKNFSTDSRIINIDFRIRQISFQIKIWDPSVFFGFSNQNIILSTASFTLIAAFSSCFWFGGSIFFIMFKNIAYRSKTNLTCLCNISLSYKCLLI